MTFNSRQRQSNPSKFTSNSSRYTTSPIYSPVVERKSFYTSPVVSPAVQRRGRSDNRRRDRPEIYDSHRSKSRYRERSKSSQRKLEELKIREERAKSRSPGRKYLSKNSKQITPEQLKKVRSAIFEKLTGNMSVDSLFSDISDSPKVAVTEKPKGLEEILKKEPKSILKNKVDISIDPEAVNRKADEDPLGLLNKQRRNTLYLIRDRQLTQEIVRVEYQANYFKTSFF